MNKLAWLKEVEEELVPIKDQGQVDVTTLLIKEVKTVVKAAEDKKKNAVKPWEHKRKQADTELIAARAGKVAAAEPFLEEIALGKELEKKMKGNVVTYITYLEQKEAKRLADIERKKQEVEQLRIESEEAKARFVETKKEEELKEIEDVLEAANEIELEIQQEVPIEPVINNASVREVLSYEVIDACVNDIPSKYFDTTLDTKLLQEELLLHFPGIHLDASKATIVNASLVLGNYLLEDIVPSRVISDLRNDINLVIPGIKRIKEKSIAV